MGYSELDDKTVYECLLDLFGKLNPVKYTTPPPLDIPRHWNSSDGSWTCPGNMSYNRQLEAILITKELLDEFEHRLDGIGPPSA